MYTLRARACARERGQGIGDIMGWLAGIVIVAFVVLIILWKTEQQRRREVEARLAALQRVVEQVREGLG